MPVLILIALIALGVYTTMHHSNLVETCTTQETYDSLDFNGKKECEEKRLHPDPKKMASLEQAWQEKDMTERREKMLRKIEAEQEARWRKHASKRAREDAKKVQERLNVPDSADFRDVYYVEYNGSWHTCGFVSGKNLFGVRLKSQPFVVLSNALYIGDTPKYVEYCTLYDKRHQVFI